MVSVFSAVCYRQHERPGHGAPVPFKEIELAHTRRVTIEAHGRALLYVRHTAITCSLAFMASILAIISIRTRGSQPEVEM